MFKPAPFNLFVFIQKQCIYVSRQCPLWFIQVNKKLKFREHLRQIESHLMMSSNMTLRYSCDAFVFTSLTERPQQLLKINHHLIPSPVPNFVSSCSAPEVSSSFSSIWSTLEKVLLNSRISIMTPDISRVRKLMPNSSPKLTSWALTITRRLLSMPLNVDELTEESNRKKTSGYLQYKLRKHLLVHNIASVQQGEITVDDLVVDLDFAQCNKVVS